MEKITIETLIHAPMEKVWKYFNEPEHIVGWGSASADWHTTRATNDLTVGGVFNYRMESRDGTEGFDFEGVYETVVPHEFISYGMSDGRKVEIAFSAEGDEVHITETFDPETENPVEMQRAGWQAILDNFKRYTEEN